MTRIAIIGAGAFGTALANVTRRNGHEVVMWALESNVAQSINNGEGNPVFLPDIALEDGIAASTDLGTPGWQVRKRRCS